MSLQVWLPLNGNLNNQGLSDNIITNNGATVNNSGKIGKCYSFNGSSSKISTSINLTTEMSFCVWAKMNAISNFIIDARNSSGQGYQPIYISTTGVQIYSSASPAGGYVNYSFSTGVWYHIAVIYSNNKGYLYINGSLIGSVSVGALTLENSILSIGGRYNNQSYYNGFLNDVRVYDHALSIKEIKEISKGLCLHYKLNTNSESLLGNPNLAINTPLAYTYTAKHGYSIDTNFKNNLKDILLYAKQNNLGFTLSYDINVPKCWPNAANTYNRCGVYWGFSVKDNSTGTTYQWYGNHSGPNTATDKHNYALGTNSLNAMTASATESNPDTRFVGHYSCTVYPQNQSNATMKGFFSNPNNYTLGTPYLNVEITGNTVDEASITNIKLELGNEETTWCPNVDDKEYNIFKSNSNVEYDCSGFGNHGVISGTFSTSTSNGRYQLATKFTSTSSKIKLPTLTYSAFGNSYTFSWWQYNVGSGNMPWGFSDGNRLNLYHSTNLFWNTGDGGNNPFTPLLAASTLYNAWHHIVITGNGTDTKLYVDGVYKGKATTYKALTGTQIYISGWDAGTSYTMNGSSMSDFRIYSTCLNDDDILELYEVGASVAKGDTIHSYEYIEELNNLIQPIQEALSKKVYENGLLSYTQQKCSVTLTDDGYRIFRPADSNGTSSSTNPVWGGLKLEINRTYQLQKGHTYIIKWNVKGKSSNAPTSIGFDNKMGWGGGGLRPSPSNVSYLYTPANFDGEMECFYKFTINDDIYKECTTSYSSFVAGQTYLSYKDFQFGFTYQNTGTMGTDLYLNNFRMYDITAGLNHPKIQKNILQCSTLNEASGIHFCEDGEVIGKTFYEI